MNWGIDTDASTFLFDLFKKLKDKKSLVESDIQGLAFFIGKVIVLEQSFKEKYE